MTTLTLNWERVGTGEPLLLLHGIGSTRDDWASVRPRLAAEFDVLSVDLPGHGESPTVDGRPTVALLADAIERDLDRMGLSRMHIVGNSLGGRLALELARRDRALSVVAIAPSGLALPTERMYQAMLLGATHLVTRSIRPLIYPLAEFPAGRTALLAGLKSRPWAASQPEARAMKDGFADARQFWRTLWWSILVDQPTGLAKVTCPVILAQGTADFIAGGQTPRYLVLVPGARFRPLLGAGHAAQSDAPGAVVRLVHEAVRRAHAGTDRVQTVPAR
jgi:pimeloyl-ACP methyl ester carboxylesterase